MTIINGNFSDEETLVTPTLNGLYPHASHTTIQLVRVGHLVFVSGLAFTSTPSTSIPSGTTLFTVPVGFRPKTIAALAGRTQPTLGTPEVETTLNVYPTGEVKNDDRAILNWLSTSQHYTIFDGS